MIRGDKDIDAMIMGSDPYGDRSSRGSFFCPLSLSLLWERAGERSCAAAMAAQPFREKGAAAARPREGPLSARIFLRAIRE
jgi:hypothetical protein